MVYDSFYEKLYGNLFVGNAILEDRLQDSDKKLKDTKYELDCLRVNSVFYCFCYLLF